MHNTHWISVLAYVCKHMYVVCTIAHTFVYMHLLIFKKNIFIKKYVGPVTCVHTHTRKQSRISELPYPMFNENNLLQVQSWNTVHLRTSCLLAKLRLYHFLLLEYRGT